MTRDAFYKARELDDELTAINALTNIIVNGTLSTDEEYYKGHNDHVRKDKMILCYMSHDSMFSSDNNVTITNATFDSYKKFADTYKLEGCMWSKDIPAELADELEKTIGRYRQKIEEEFESLTSDYQTED